MTIKDLVSGGWGKKSTESSASSPESLPSSRSVSPNIPGAYHDSSPRANQDDSSNNRNHASHNQQDDVRVESDRSEQATPDRPRGNSTTIVNTVHVRASNLSPNTRARSEAPNNQIAITSTNGRGHNGNRYAPLDGVEASSFSTNLIISARAESNNSHPLQSTEYYRNNVGSGNDGPHPGQSARSPRPGVNGRSSDQSRPFPTAAVVSTPGSRRKAHLRRMASDTIAALESGFYNVHGTEVSIGEEIVAGIKQTQFYGPDTPRLVQWLTAGKPVDINAAGAMGTRTQVSVLNISTLAGARLLENVYQRIPGAGTGSNSNPSKCFTGVLNFASATKPGGGFQNGAEAQEESLARASTLFASLQSSEQAQMFYRLHAEESRENLLAYYSHAIVYSPGVLVLRDDEDGSWFERPFAVDVLSCAAVNAGEVRRSAGGGPRPGRVATAHLEVDIEKEMTERMARILCVFEFQGVRNLVLGTFGTGVFQNKVDVVARIWAHLLIRPEARFKDVFDRVIFAITGQETFVEFQSAFSAWGQERAAGHGKTSVPTPRGAGATGDLIDL
ncbi:hypothetical protein D9619_011837 [Psilocybe cf. subviscida]|uniref:Microbial-type PARG catalytic domain-containing protein n=1 Tax=Psilocybe cf. subviscida TaxID=2480587 RepID=A0A8H5EWC7_9AGAR|nr:hypothetical protein D9619_011837 [Psilocybe cf. subviscida]